jgi:glucose-1-phosphate cytidylyltransferase
MKVVILCGGLGSRLAEETKRRPKPMVKIGNKPILIHIMRIYKKNGFNDFILAGGYKCGMLKKYFKMNKEFKNVKIVNTGLNNLTSKRLHKLKKYLKNEENFMLTYGDGLTNQNLKKLLEYHIKHKKIATVTAVRTPVRFGEMQISGNKVKNFREKRQAKNSWINGGFFVFSSKIFKFVSNKNIMLEMQPMNQIVKKKELTAFKHTGFWQCMDTMRDKEFLINLLKTKKAPWLN